VNGGQKNLAVLGVMLVSHGFMIELLMDMSLFSIHVGYRDRGPPYKAIPAQDMKASEYVLNPSKDGR
jgi:hypothetical protein